MHALWGLGGLLTLVLGSVGAFIGYALGSSTQVHVVHHGTLTIRTIVVSTHGPWTLLGVAIGLALALLISGIHVEKELLDLVESRKNADTDEQSQPPAHHMIFEKGSNPTIILGDTQTGAGGSGGATEGHLPS